MSEFFFPLLLFAFSSVADFLFSTLSTPEIVEF